jgi:hypothetical protein
VLLDGNNYNMWTIQVSFGLIDRDKLEYVNDELTMAVQRIFEALTEDEKKTIREWRKSDNIVVGWILATMEPHIQDYDIPRYCQTNVG